MDCGEMQPPSSQVPTSSRDLPTQYVNFGTPGHELPPSAHDLVQDIKHLKDHTMVPAYLTDHVMHYLVDRKERREYVESDFGCTLTTKPNGLTEGLTVAQACKWQAIQELQQAASDCRNNGLSESEWNRHVNCPILKMALASLFKEANGSLKSEGKMAADPIALRMPRCPRKAQQVNDLLEKIEEALVDPSDSQYMRCNSYSVPIEAKGPQDGERTASPELIDWIHDQFDLMEGLSRGNSQLPILPMIMIQGHSWFLLMACRVKDRIIIYRDVDIGVEGTRSVVGIFQILKGIELLVELRDNDFRTWYETNGLK
ncbi:MAG: hypothetical protein Q9220_006171 [cf. Caloplaca sp. 1 TL-2023]